ERDNESARAADAGSGRKIARECDVRAPHLTGEVHSDTARNSDRVVGPVPGRRLDIGRKFQFRDVTRACIEYAHSVRGTRGQCMCTSRAGYDADSAFHGAQETPAAAVIGVLAQNFDSPRHPEGHRIVGSGWHVTAEPCEVTRELRDASGLDL